MQPLREGLDVCWESHWLAAMSHWSDVECRLVAENERLSRLAQGNSGGWNFNREELHDLKDSCN